MIRNQFLAVCSVLLLSIVPTDGFAVDISRVVSDFAVKNGVVVLTRDDDAVIDLDASDGVVTGDLFTIFEPGESLVHPDTGQTIGTLDRVAGVFTVTQVRPGYSRVRRIYGTAIPAPGDPVRRFDGLSAVFRDRRGDGEAIFVSLRSRIPSLDWKGYERVPETAGASAGADARLVFSLEPRGLIVRDSAGRLIRAYPETGTAPAQTSGWSWT